MITKVVTGNVFDTQARHIAYAINTQGFNDSGFAGQVATHCPQLANTGENSLGAVVTAEANGKFFHGLVCHSLEPGGWKEAPKSIIASLERIETEDDEPIAVVLMGAGMIGQMSGADVRANVKAIHESKKNCILYTLDYNGQAVLKVLQLKKFPAYKQLPQ